MKVELTIACGNACIKAQVTYRKHLNDLLQDNGIDYTNRPDNCIDIYIDDAINASKLSQIVRWLDNASTSIRGARI